MQSTVSDVGLKDSELPIHEGSQRASIECSRASSFTLNQAGIKESLRWIVINEFPRTVCPGGNLMR